MSNIEKNTQDKPMQIVEDDRRVVLSHSLPLFVSMLEEAYADGYDVLFEGNDFPQQNGILFQATVVKMRERVDRSAFLIAARAAKKTKSEQLKQAKLEQDLMDAEEYNEGSTVASAIA